MSNHTVSLKPRVGVCSLSSPLEVGADRAPNAAEELVSVLIAAGCEVVNVGPVGGEQDGTEAGRRFREAHVDAVACAVVCWHEDYLVVDMLEECDCPILLWALPGMETGALCATQQLTCFLKQLDVPYKSIFGQIDDAACLTEGMSFLRGAALRSRLRRCRVGAGGDSVRGMTHTAPNPFMLKKAIGPRIVSLDLPSLLSRSEEMPHDKAKERWQTMTSKVACCEVDDEAGIDSMRVYAALRECVEADGLNVLTIGCYPHLMGRVCLAASLLADDGIPMACEGDVHGAVGQYMLQLLSGTPTHNADWLDPVDEHSAVFTHCGSGSFTLAEKPDEIKLASVRLMGQGACALFPARTGPVTMLNINASADGYQCALLEGEAESTEMVFPGNPVRVRFAQPIKTLLPWIHEEGLGHHWMIGYGSYASEIQDWAKIASRDGNLRLIQI